MERRSQMKEEDKEDEEDEEDEKDKEEEEYEEDEGEEEEEEEEARSPVCEDLHSCGEVVSKSRHPMLQCVADGVV